MRWWKSQQMWWGSAVTAVMPDGSLGPNKGRRAGHWSYGCSSVLLVSTCELGLNALARVKRS